MLLNSAGDNFSLALLEYSIPLPESGIDARFWLRMLTPDFSAAAGWLFKGASCTP